MSSYGAESGRLWKEHAEYFHFSERIDQVLLDNLATSYRLLHDDTGLSPDAAQALLVQVMFIAYLEDREIILPEVFENASDGRAGSFSDLLKLEDIDSLERLFESLRRDFNGDLFVAPCSFDENDHRPPLTPTHLNILRRFHSGHEEMHGNAGQHRFWGYDFKYIPIELISAVSARKRLVQDVRIFRIINFADLRFQLFEGAVRPAALIIFGHSDQEAPAYRFEYWTPKADLNLKIKRLITLSSADKCLVTSTMAAAEPLVFKQRLWMNDPESKLFNDLSAFPKLGDLAKAYGAHQRKGKSSGDDHWLIGQGFQPFNANRAASQSTSPSASDSVGKLPYLPIDAFTPLAQPLDSLSSWPSNQVRRRGFERGFSGPRVLIPRGVDTIGQRLRAAYLEEPLTFQHTIQALVVPRGEERRAKLLTALLNSRLIAWFAFHGTASFGSERPEVQQADLLTLPFPSPDDMPQRERSESAANALVASIDRMIEAADGPFDLRGDERTNLEMPWPGTIGARREGSGRSGDMGRPIQIAGHPFPATRRGNPARMCGRAAKSTARGRHHRQPRQLAAEGSMGSAPVPLVGVSVRAVRVYRRRHGIQRG